MNTRNIYHLVTVDDVHADSAAILNVFSAMKAGRIPCDIKLLNYYREIPVSYNASILDISEDKVELAIHQNQALVMKFDKHTLIKSKHFRDNLGVHCFATYINTAKEVAILIRFAYAQIKAERRNAIRVTVDPALPAIFSNETIEISGKALDISETGLSIFSTKEPVIKENVQGTLTFKLTDSHLKVQATFFRTIEAENGFINIFQYELTGNSEKTITQYIYKRQVEIIRELKDNV